jgi:hypothetical protein
MADPTAPITCTAGAWTKIATAVTAVTVWFDKKTGVDLYRIAQVDTGGTAPTGETLGHTVTFGKGWPFTADVSKDLYVWVRGTVDGSVTVEDGVFMGPDAGAGGGGGAAYDPVTGTIAVTVDNQESQNYVPDQIIVPAVPNGTPEEIVIAMDGYSGCSVEVTKTGGTDNFTGAYWMSNEGSDPGDNRFDITTAWTFLAGAANTDHAAVPSDVNTIPRFFILIITTAGGANDATFEVEIKKFALK